ncbi:uncharacterized protein LOC116287378 [Actinia tenebrosa]|uniref:Uncharacterized protein LOC116287378 n=1 Tax=Actinia tenebrosa TaxID=6105 RepID=A0A6P8HB65_ACTTE|nr:uncharacterized protein LOC116287378 [Actinia tenebrosa]
MAERTTTGTTVRKRSWDRFSIVRCHCEDLAYTHVHCPCEKCDGKAVSFSLEYIHWNKKKSIEIETANDEYFENDDCASVGDKNSMDSSHSDNQSDSAEHLSAHEEPTSSSSFHSETESENQFNAIELEIICTILRAMNLAAQMNGSNKDFDDVLQFAKELFCREDPDLETFWPKNWRETKRLLQNYGYKDPKELYICLDDSHYTLWDVMTDPSSECRYCGKRGSIKYYYLGLSDKIVLWCQNTEMCRKMMAHWDNKDSWIEGTGSNFPLKEIWDGSRFNELSWFWDPNITFMLPFKCQFCQSVISVDEIESSEHLSDNSYNVLCSECGFRQVHTSIYTYGDPRNIALIGHWDGWQPFGASGRHSCGAVEVTIANMYKKERSSTEEIYVIGFVPSHCLPKKRPNCLDPFLHPLISEAEELFISGLQVDYSLGVAGLPPGEISLRCLIILWTGDYPGQCEVGKFIKSGIRPCRRDKLKGIAVESTSATGVHYYYGDNRYHARYLFDARNLLEDLGTMKEIDQEDRKSIRSKMSRNTGYTGLSILHKLYKLYGFNVITDCVFDMMHNLPMNVVSNHFQMLIDSDKINKKVIDERLNAVPWTPELKDGRIPEGMATRLGYWKAEEYQKFAYPLSECILAGQLDGLDYHIWQLVTRMVELVFSESKREEWDIADVELFHNLAWRYAVLLEETYGLSFCTITVHNLIHVKEDALRFSHPDNYWCFSFERAVRRYVNTTTNFKNIECTYAKKEKRRELMKLLNTSPLLQNRRHKPLQIDIDKMCAKSLEAAHELIKVVNESHIPHVNRCNRGVLVGGMSANECILLREQVTQIVDCCSGVNAQDVQPVAFKSRSLLKPLHGIGGVLYRVGEHAVVEDIADVETVIEFTAFYCVAIRNDFYTFCEGRKYQTMKDDDGNDIIHQYSGYKFVNEMQNVTTFCPSKISRKLMLFPCFEQEENTGLIAVDYLRKQMPINQLQDGIVVPFYPEVDDMVLVRGDEAEPWLAKVIKVHRNSKTVLLWYYKKAAESDDECTVYIAESNRRLARDIVSWDSIISLAPGGWVNNYWDTMA